MGAPTHIIFIIQHLNAIFSDRHDDPFERALEAFVRQHPPHRRAVVHPARKVAQGRMDR
jgi:hypothetical protein